MSKIGIDDELLEQLKTTMGDFDSDELNDYYITHLEIAQSDLMTDDISADQLLSPLGRALTVLYAEALINKTDIATNPTISLLRNKLSIMTKGDRVDV